MKESGMEKLIELFRDYVENYGDDTKDPTKDYVVIYDGQGFYVGARFYSDEKVLSKKFGFIKWLVDNDKIDFIRLDDDSNWYDINTESEYLDILALLSIQDNPIEFLCEILK